MRICTKTFVHYCSLVRNEKLHADSNVENLRQIIREFAFFLDDMPICVIISLFRDKSSIFKTVGLQCVIRQICIIACGTMLIALCIHMY